MYLQNRDRLTNTENRLVFAKQTCGWGGDEIGVTYWGFPGGASGKEPICQCRRRKRCVFGEWIVVLGPCKFSTFGELCCM